MPAIRKKHQYIDDISVFIDKAPIQAEKTTSTWVAILVKLQLYHILQNCISVAYKQFCANRQCFINAVSAHGKYFLELYLFAALFASLLAVNMLYMTMVGLGHVKETVVITIIQLVLYLLARVSVVYEQLEYPDKDKCFLKLSKQLLTKRNVEKIRITVDVLRNRRTAKLVHYLLAITLAVLLCSLATILVDILLLNCRPLLDGLFEFEEFTEFGLFTFFQAIFNQFALLLGFVVFGINWDYNDKELL